MPHLAMLKNSLRIFWIEIRIPEADDFQNVISSSLCTDTSVVKFREDPFTKILSQMWTTKKLKSKFWTSSAPGSGCRDFLKRILQHCEIEGIFPQFGSRPISGQTDRMFMKILPQM